LGRDSLTIVIPAYNCAKYLTAAIVSALRCEIGCILVGDNCSTDDTLRVARSWETRSGGRVRVIANPSNIGARNNCQNLMENVNTTYGLVLSADDIISSEYVRSAVALLDREVKLGMIGAVLQRIDDDFGLSGDSFEEPECPVESFTILSGISAGRLALGWYPFPAMSATILRMSAFREVGGYSTILKATLDREIWFRIGRTHDVAFCNTPGVFYRVLATGETARFKKNDMWCYELSNMFRAARKIWPEPELQPRFRRAFRINGKAFFGSAVRAVKRGAWREVMPRVGRGFADLWNAIT